MSRIEHRNHRVPDDLAANVRAVRELELAKLARQEEIARRARPSAGERKTIAELQDPGASGRPVTGETQQRLRDINTRKFERVKEAFDLPIAAQSPFTLPPWILEPERPQPADPTFWWASTDWWHPNHFAAALRHDGLHFWGGVTTHDGDLHFDSFGAVALFELHNDRIPTSLSHRWRSTPHIELFGGIQGYTGDDDLATGDLWSKCWLHLDQQIYQPGFGTNHVLAEGHDVKQLIFEENRDRPVHVPLPGFLWMPPVTFSNIVLTGSSVWARLEIRFDIQTEGPGTLVWMDPEVLLRTFQWQLTPL